MSRLIGSSVAGVMALTISLGAQNPPSGQTARPAAGQSADQSSMMVTVEGCLYRENDVPGRRPPEAERARTNRDEDYIVAGARMVKGAAPAGAPAAGAGTATGTSGTTAAAMMFKVEAPNELKISEHAGHRVQIDGTFDQLDRATNPVSPAMELVKLRATALRKASGDCPRQTDSRK